MVDVAYAEFPVVTFVPTPARSFVFIGCEFDDLHFEIDTRDLSGAHVRIRFSLSEERRHEVDRTAIEGRVMAKGAALIKVDYQVIPTQRQRAAGISQATSLAAKVQRWAEVTDVILPARVLEVAGRIEGQEVDELLREANQIPDAVVDRVEATLNGNLSAYPTRKEITGYSTRSEERLADGGVANGQKA